MNTFTASSGMTVERRANEDVVIDGYTTFMSDGTALALREFFRAEEDERLGRWRWPENRDYVVYAEPDAAFTSMFGPDLDLVILRESDGMTKGYVRSEDQGGMPMAHRVGHILAARAYFDAHPESKPWHKARGGEVWDVDLGEGGIRAVTLDLPTGLVFRDPYGPREIEITSSDVRDARRVYPEEVA